MNDESKELMEIFREMFEVINNKLETGLKSIDDRLTKLELMQENEVKKGINLLAEGYMPLADKVDKLSEDMEVVKFDVDIIKKVVTTHSSELNKLGKAK